MSTKLHTDWMHNQTSGGVWCNPIIALNKHRRVVVESLETTVYDQMARAKDSTRRHGRLYRWSGPSVRKTIVSNLFDEP